MRTALRAAAALAVTALTLAACGGTGDVAACKAAMTRDYATALARPGASPASQPAACKGLSADTLNRLAGEVMAGVTPTATPSTEASAPSAADVARDLHATSVQPMDPTLYASDEATAVWDGRDVDIATFATEQLKEQWKTAAGQFGTTILLSGPLYVVADNGPAS